MREWEEDEVVRIWVRIRWEMARMGRWGMHLCGGRRSTILRAHSSQVSLSVSAEYLSD